VRITRQGCPTERIRRRSDEGFLSSTPQ
jgi:hypothetical protein